jgi:hypothetical protein
MTQSQKEFEEWAKSKNMPVIKSKSGSYLFNETHYCWESWQASRQALAVDLSSLPESNYNTTGTCYVSHVDGLLDKAGITYK